MTKYTVSVSIEISDLADHKEFGLKNNELTKLVDALGTTAVERNETPESVSVTVDVERPGSLHLVTDLIDTIQATMEKPHVMDTSFTFTDDVGEMTVELSDVAVADIVG